MHLPLTFGAIGNTTLGQNGAVGPLLGSWVIFFFFLILLPKNSHGFHFCAHCLNHADSLISVCLGQWHLCTADLRDYYPQLGITWQEQGICVYKAVSWSAWHFILCHFVWTLLFALVWPRYLSELSGTRLYFILNVTSVSVCHCCDGIALMLSSVPYSLQLSFIIKISLCKQL